MAPPSLPAELFASVFPFHLTFDRQLVVGAVGTSMRKLLPTLQPGAALLDVLRVERPAGVDSFEAMRGRTRSLFVLGASRDDGADVQLRGQLVALDSETLLFLGSPWVGDVSDLARLRLSLDDFALHDATTDLLHVLQVQTSSAEDHRALAERLSAANEALHSSKLRLSAMIEHLHYGVLVEDESRQLVLANEAFCGMFGIDAAPAALVGVDCNEAAQHSSRLFVDPDGFIADIEETLVERRVVQGLLLELEDGRTLSRDYVPIFADDRYRGHLWQYRDVTHRQRSEQRLLQSEQRKSAVLEAALDAIVTIDSSGTIVEWNPAAVELFGWSRDEAVGRSMAELIVPEQHRRAHHHGMTRLLEGGTPRILGKRLQLQALRKDGTLMPCEVAITEIPRPEGQLFTGFLRDISERERAERALRGAKEIAERASYAKTDFLATMSHEMRTPLNAILGMSELLAETALIDEQREYLGTLSTSAEVLLALISDFLDFSKIETGQLDIDELPFDVAEVLRSVVRILTPRARARGVSLRSRLDARVPRALVGDPNRLRQILLNLVGNAIKFTDEGTVSIDVSVSETLAARGTRLRVAVHDTGIGISDDDRERIFKSFFQAPTGARRVGGTGLGLAICRSLAQLMGGDVWLERSEPGVGSTFCLETHLSLAVDAPRKATSSTWLAVASESPERATPARVLVAEDNADNWRIIERVLEGAGHCVRHAEDGEQAVAMFAPGRYDVVLMDVELPMIDGIEAARRIRARERELGAEPTPIVALTAHALEDVRHACIEAGMNDFIVKPVRKTTLIAVVEFVQPATPAVLVVDDAPESLAVTVRFVERSGYRACWAHSGERALQILARRALDCLIVDLEMPGTSGLQVLESVRGELSLDTPVIVLSGHDDAATAARCLAAGCDRYLVKPVRRNVLLPTLAELLDARPEEANSSQITVAVDADIADLAEEYIDKRHAEVGHLQSLCAQARFEEIRVIGHNLKGSAGAYGFDKMGTIGAALELAGQTADAQAAEEAREQLASYLARVVIDTSSS